MNTLYSQEGATARQLSRGKIRNTGNHTDENVPDFDTRGGWWRLTSENGLIVIHGLERGMGSKHVWTEETVSSRVVFFFLFSVIFLSSTPRHPPIVGAFIGEVCVSLLSHLKGSCDCSGVKTLSFPPSLSPLPLFFLKKCFSLLPFLPISSSSSLSDLKSLITGSQVYSCYILT